MKKGLGGICALFLMLSSGAADAAYPWDKDRGELEEIRVLVDDRPYVFHVRKEGWCQPTVVVDQSESDFGCDGSVDYLRAMGKLERFIHDKCPAATRIEYTEAFLRTQAPPGDLTALSAEDLFGEWEGQGRTNTVVAHFLRNGTVIWFNSPRALASPDFSNSMRHQWELATGAKPAIGLWTPKTQRPDPIAQMFPGLPSSARLGPGAFADYSEIVATDRRQPYCHGPRIDHLTLAAGEAIPELRRSNRERCRYVVSELQGLIRELEEHKVPAEYLNPGFPLFGPLETYAPYRKAYVYLTGAVADLQCRNFDSGVGHYPQSEEIRPFPVCSIARYGTSTSICQ